MKGRPVASEDDPNDETKIPKHAKDLRDPDISLDLRRKRLDQVLESKKKLKGMEIFLIFSPRIQNENSTNNESFPKTRKALALIRTKIDQQNLTVPCEMGSCSGGKPRVKLYKNLCDGCLLEKFNINENDITIDSEHKNNIVYDLMTIRNLHTRLAYLESELSSSLSNQLSRTELISVINEIDALHNII